MQSSLNSEELIAAFSGLTCIDVDYLIDMFFGDTCNFDVNMYESIGTSSFEDIESVLERFVMLYYLTNIYCYNHNTCIMITLPFYLQCVVF